VISCRYCGVGNDNDAVYCTRCGSNDWKELTMPTPLASNLAVQPNASLSEVGITAKGNMTSIQCRTLSEAALVADQLEQADILPLLSDELPQKDPQNSATDSSIEVQVSAKALAAEKELSESLNFRSDVHCARQPLPLVMRIVALCLPALLPLGCLIFMAEAGRFRNQGFARKLREWKRWFLFGLVVWAAAVLFLIHLAGT